MKRRWIILPALLVVLGLGAIAFFLIFHREPMYQGKTTREWLKDWPRTAWYRESGPVPGAVRPPAVAALQAMGADAVPWVRRELGGYTDWRTFFPDLMDRWRKRKAAINPFRIPADPQRYIALDALAAIGPPASAAVPDIVALLPDPNFELRARCMMTLGAIHQRPDIALPPLINCLAVESGPIQDYAVQAISRFGSEIFARGANLPGTPSRERRYSGRGSLVAD
jgi:HEAT repeat protein